MRLRLSLLIFLMFLSGCELGTEPANQVSPNYHLLSACQPSDNTFIAATVAAIVKESLCGSIPVWEDRELQAGRRIDLNVMLLPATSSVVKPDPIFLLAGGPGQAAVDIGPFLFARLDKLRQERDIVLVDQRGTGASNSLACELEASAFDQMHLTLEQANAQQADTLKKCLALYDADPALYTTPIAMDDLNEVRQTLGYEKINLIGISYGTRAGQVYLRRHENTVRTLTLDAVVPMTLPIPRNVAIDAQTAFDTLLADCTAQAACHQAFPDLEAHFKTLVDRLRETPSDIKVSHPRTGMIIEGPFAHQLVNRIIRNILYDRNLSRLLPLAIEEAYQGNFQILTTIAYSLTGDSLMMSTGMMMSVLCSEDMTAVDESGGAPDFDNPLYEVLASICPFWPRGSIPSDYFTPVSSDVPVLVTSGALDPITPPKYGDEVVKTFSNATHIVVQGVGHGTLTAGCMPGVLANFINSADPKNLSHTCTDNLSRPLFFTSFAGPVTDIKVGTE